MSYKDDSVRKFLMGIIIRAVEDFRYVPLEREDARKFFKEDAHVILNYLNLGFTAEDCINQLENEEKTTIPPKDFVVNRSLTYYEQNQVKSQSFQSECPSDVYTGEIGSEEF